MSVDYNDLRKVDIINGAFSRLRISGLTVDASGEDMELALTRLEDMAYEFSSRNMDGNYNFESLPDPNSEIGIFPEFKEAYETNLAVRITPDFGQSKTNPLLLQQANQSARNLAARSARTRQTQYPERQPRGSGVTLRYYPFSPHYRNVDRAPINSDILRVGEVNDYTETWASYLNELETITDHTIVADSGIVVVRSSVDGPDVKYRLRLDNILLGSGDEIQGTSRSLTANTVEIEITTSEGRINRRKVYYNTQR